MLTDNDRPYRGRRITWREFARLVEREAPEAVNDNQQWARAQLDDDRSEKKF